MNKARVAGQTWCGVAVLMGFCILATSSLLAQSPKPKKLALHPTSKPAASQPVTNPKNLPKELILDLGNDIGIKLVLIPAGKFIMGSPENEKGRNANEGPQHEVTIAKPFYMGAYLVTWTQWRRMMGLKNDRAIMVNGKIIKIPEDDIRKPYCPDWYACQEFCEKLSAQTGYTVRLPSEAEWEYACRAGSTTRYCFGDDLDYFELADYAWHKKNWVTGGHSVGEKKPNAWGLYDMHGYVWEWCQDEYHSDYVGSPIDGSAWVEKNHNFKTEVRGEDCPLRVIRGGSTCSELLSDLRSATRDAYVPFREGPLTVGFRIVVESPNTP